MKTKIFSIIMLIFLIPIGGAYLFIQTKSDFILNKVSALVEESSGAPLTIESLPSLGIIPSPSLTIGKASWGTKDFSITFDEAKIEFSFFALLRGEVSLSGSYYFDNLKLIYNNNAIVEKIEPQKTGKQPAKIETQVSDILTKIFNVVPDNIIIKNGFIEYTDKHHHVVMKDINTVIDNFGISQNAKVKVSSHVAYTMLAEKNAKNYDFVIDTDFNFLFMGENINFELTKFLINPQAGFNFQKEISISASTDILLHPFHLRSLSAQINSPFMNAKINPLGDITLAGGAFNLLATVFPLAIVETFAPNKKFEHLNQLEEAQLSSTVTFKDNIFSLQNLELQSEKSTIKSSLTYDMTKDQFFGDINIDNIQLEHFIPTHVPGEEQETFKSPSPKSDKNAKSTLVALPSPLQKTNFKVKLNASDISYDKIAIDSIDTILQGKNSLLFMNPIKMQGMGSSMLAKLHMDFTKKQNIAMDIDVPAINVNTWSKALLNGDALSGDASVKSAINFPINDPMSNANGKGEIQLSDLHIQTQYLPLIMNVLQANKINPENYHFVKGYIPFNINKSIAHLNNAYLSSPALDIKTNGDINLKNQGLNLKTQVEIAQKLSIPVDIKGYIKDPKISIGIGNPIKIIDKLVNVTLKKESKKDIKGVFNKLFGK